MSHGYGHWNDNRIGDDCDDQEGEDCYLSFSVLLSSSNAMSRSINDLRLVIPLNNLA